MLFLNLSDRGFTGWTLAWILVSGLVGALGGVGYLLSLETDCNRSRPWRVDGWLAMLAAVMLPTSLTFILVPMVLFTAFALRLASSRGGRHIRVMSRGASRGPNLGSCPSV